MVQILEKFFVVQWTKMENEKSYTMKYQRLLQMNNRQLTIPEPSKHQFNPGTLASRKRPSLRLTKSAKTCQLCTIQ